MSLILPTPRASLIKSGIDDGRVDRDLRAGRSVAPFRGVHVEAAYAEGWLPHVRAALATQSSEALIGMQSSAALHQLRYVPQSWSAAVSDVDIVVPPEDAHRQRRGLRLHERSTIAADRDLVRGIPCLGVARTLVELARLRLPELLVVQIIDGALFDRRTTKAKLLECADRFAGERNIAIARRRIQRSRDRVRSAQETRLRLMLEDAGIEVDVAIEIRDDDEGELLAEGDLGIKKLLIWGEYDGFEEHTQRRVFRGDRVRDRWIDRRGWKVMRFADEAFVSPTRTVAEWRHVIAEAPARIAALDPRRSPEVAEARRLLGIDPPLRR
jgi:hypothetical protein